MNTGLSCRDALRICQRFHRIMTKLPVNHENGVSYRKAIFKSLFLIGKLNFLILGAFPILSLHIILSINVFSSIISFPSVHIPTIFLPYRPLKVSSNAACTQPARSILYILHQVNLYFFPIRKLKAFQFTKSRPKVKNI